MSEMNPKEAFHNTVYSVQLPYLADPSLKKMKAIKITHQISK